MESRQVKASALQRDCGSRKKGRRRPFHGTRLLILSTVGAQAQPSRSSPKNGTLFGINMQLINAPDDNAFPAIETAIQLERIKRYLPAAGMDSKKAFKYYLWNCALCESFVFSLHFSEIVCRNTLHKGLLNRCGESWYNDKTFRIILDEKYLNELNEAYSKELKQHGDNTTANHICSALPFAFWEHLTTKRFERFLWSKGIRNIFPCAPKEMTLLDLHDLIESVRRWRNRIAHHQAIFDKSPTKKHQDTLRLISIACDTTHSWVASGSRVPIALGLRPQ